MQKARPFVALAALAGTILTSSVPAQAEGEGGQTFSSYGECRKVLARLRNETRQTDGLFGPGYTGSFNAWVRYNYDCIELDRDLWIIART